MHHPRRNVGNARNKFERYTDLAKDAARRGDVIEAENFYQHAEHYFRMMRENEQGQEVQSLHPVRRSEGAAEARGTRQRGPSRPQAAVRGHAGSASPPD